MKLSDYVVKFFEKQKVKNMFMVSGGGCMHLVDSFGRSQKIKYWCTQHEQAAAMAAESYAKMKNNLGLVLVTSGPGTTNTITGLLGAYQDSIPCVFISGQAKRRQTVYNSGIPSLRQFGVQEVNIIPIVQSITKYAVIVNKPEKIRYYLEKAVYLAKSGRPGPVWLDIPLDVQGSLINEEDLVGFSIDEDKDKINTIPSEEDLDYIVEQLSHAKRPVVIAGHGIRLADACLELNEFLTKYHIPAVTPIMGIDVLSGENPCNIGRVGTKGTRAGNFAMQNADFILSIGSRLSVSVVGHEYNLFAREAKIAVVDIDEYEHQKQTIKIDRLVVCDAKAFLKKIQTRMLQVDFSDWQQVCLKWRSKYPVCLPEYRDDSKGINFYEFIELLSQCFQPNMPVVSDAGSAFYVVSQGINLKCGQRYITSGAIATMGFSLPAAIGVAVADLSNTVLAITGDGSFQQNIQELEVVKYHNLPIKLFVMNNNGYFSIHQTQKKFFDGNFVGESSISGISCPSTEKIAEAYGIPYLRLETVEACQDHLQEVVTVPGPIIIEVMLTTDQEIMPTNASLMRADGVMISKPLEDMYPFLSRQEFAENMIVPTIKE